MPAIDVQQLGKQYNIGAAQANYQTLRDTLAQAVNRLLTRGEHQPTSIWALRNVSFAVEPGEVVGIIGNNGAGKSTLLKILAEITEPTEGQAIIRGRVGSLLEIGVGFHQELTGRENIFLYGAILGMKRGEIARKFDAIVNFAEVEQFIDTPVKRYSSGMHMRLAFSVAAHLEPDILLVDEVLAVGDAAFQKKCLSKMEEASHQGRTVLFVSHNLSAVQSLCQRAIWLSAGKVVDDGSASEVVVKYLKSMAESSHENAWPDIESAPGNDDVRIRRISVNASEAQGIITTRTAFTIGLEYWNRKLDAYLYPRIIVRNEVGISVFSSMPAPATPWHSQPLPVGLFKSTCEVPGRLLNNGIYDITVQIIENQQHVVFRQDRLLSFEIQDSPDDRGAWFGRWEGVVRPELAWHTEYLRNAPDQGGV